jgi:ubiquinone/menaquinone biosynthesis C-methylase UbiE
MQYLPPVDRQAKQQFEQPAVKKEPKPLDLKSARNCYYGKKAFTYDANRENDEKWLKELYAVEKILKALGGGRVLDIPCGTGRFFEIYKKLGMDFLGMDVSEDMMLQARAKYPEANVMFGDIAHIPLADNAVDHSVCVRLLEKMPEAEMAAVIKELARVSSKRIICSLVTGDHVERRNRAWMHRLDAFKEAVASAGFAILGAEEIREPEMYMWTLGSLS